MESEVVLDSSALVAVIMGEPGSDNLLARIKTATAVGIGSPTLLETLIVLARRLKGDPSQILSDLFGEIGIEVIPFSEEHCRNALLAFLRFGKGRHPAALNFGDCLAYAIASTASQPLLHIGNDFAQTDVLTA